MYSFLPVFFHSVQPEQQTVNPKFTLGKIISRAFILPTFVLLNANTMADLFHKNRLKAMWSVTSFLPS